MDCTSLTVFVKTSHLHVTFLAEMIILAKKPESGCEKNSKDSSSIVDLISLMSSSRLCHIMAFQSSDKKSVSNTSLSMVLFLDLVER